MNGCYENFKCMILSNKADEIVKNAFLVALQLPSNQKQQCRKKLHNRPFSYSTKEPG